jgi:hypothetical protein
MKASKVFITIDFDNVPGKYDYPQNIPLPRIGETVMFDWGKGRGHGKVYDIRHAITEGLADITIKVREE